MVAMLKRVLKHWVKMPVALDVIVIFVITILLFNYAVQPVLVSIGPMFADQSVPLSQTSRIGLETPGEIAGLVFGLSLFVMYMTVKFKLEDRYLDSSS